MYALQAVALKLLVNRRERVEKIEPRTLYHTFPKVTGGSVTIYSVTDWPENI